jgi:N-acyl-D-amino-acid deacylase
VGAVLEGGIGAEMYVASDGGLDRHVGRTLAEVAEGLGVSVTQAAYTLLADAGENFYDVVVVERWATDADLDRAVADEDFALMGDGVTGALDGPLHSLAFSLSDWGWVVRTLGHYVRDTGRLTLESAVRRMTQAPARQLGLADRGVLAPGMAADVAVFDLEDVGTAVAPDHLIVRPRGVPHVLVNGVAVVRDGEPTAARPGAIGRS